MPAKVSEKKLIVGIVCFAMGILLFFNTALFTSPLLVSEKGMLYTAIALALVAVGIFSFKSSIHKV